MICSIFNSPNFRYKDFLYKLINLLIKGFSSVLMNILFKCSLINGLEVFSISQINFLSLGIPSDAETRACFVAEKGNKWISIDYSGQETYLMASIADDKAIIKELTEGSGDIHSLTAYMSYKEIPRDTQIKDIKKKYHHYRQEAKGIEFAINKKCYILYKTV